MNDKELKATREMYNNFEQKRNQIATKRKRLYELEQEPLIQEYLELKNFIEDYRKDKYNVYNISEYIFESIIMDTKSSNNIYVYIGTFEERSTGFPGPTIYYNVYKDLETGHETMVLESQREKFDRGNKVIYINPKNEINSKAELLRKYRELRYIFLSDIIKKPQEQVVKKLMHKYSKNYR